MMVVFHQSEWSKGEEGVYNVFDDLASQVTLSHFQGTLLAAHGNHIQRDYTGPPWSWLPQLLLKLSYPRFFVCFFNVDRETNYLIHVYWYDKSNKLIFRVTISSVSEICKRFLDIFKFLLLLFFSLFLIFDELWSKQIWCVWKYFAGKSACVQKISNQYLLL